MYDSIQERLGDYQREIEQTVRQLPGQAEESSAPPVRNKEKAKAFQRRGQETMRQALYAMSGVDLTAIDGIGVETAEIVLSEYGPALEQFPTEKQSVSHLRLAPRVPKSGGKPLRGKRQGAPSGGRASQVLRTAATSLKHSRSALGAYYRRMSRQKDANVAAFATGKLAQWIYRLLRHGQEYVDQSAAAYEKSYREARVHRLHHTANQLGY